MKGEKRIEKGKGRRVAGSRSLSRALSSLLALSKKERRKRSKREKNEKSKKKSIALLFSLFSPSLFFSLFFSVLAVPSPFQALDSL